MCHYEDAISLRRLCRIAFTLSALLCASPSVQTSVFTSPLPTGVRLDPVAVLLVLGAFYGAAFSSDNCTLYVSGGNTDTLFVYKWKDGTATLANKFELAKAKTAD